MVSSLIPEGNLHSLIVSGIIDGVGGVLGFVPLIMFMFFGIALLEDSGYLARVAFMLDRVFRIFGLHGSSVMPFIVSGGIAGGCAVPGVMAARTLKSPRERLATLLTVPFMNCGAKLPVFALLIATFFSENEALAMFMITLVAWGENQVCAHSTCLMSCETWSRVGGILSSGARNTGKTAIRSGGMNLSISRCGPSLTSVT